MIYTDYKFTVQTWVLSSMSTDLKLMFVIRLSPAPTQVQQMTSACCIHRVIHKIKSMAKQYGKGMFELYRRDIQVRVKKVN